jgi:hypothetical protein
MIAVPPFRSIAEHGVAAHLKRYGAITPEKAMGYAPGRWSHARALSRLREAGVVQGEVNALWLDEAAWEDRRSKRRKRALALVAIGVVSAGIAGLTGLRG